MNSSLCIPCYYRYKTIDKSLTLLNNSNADNECMQLVAQYRTTMIKVQKIRLDDLNS